MDPASNIPRSRDGLAGAPSPGASVLVVLPSYNESANILQLVQAILDQGPSYFVCVVDDSSPDGTSRLVEDAIRARPGWKDRVELLVRHKKDGRGGAVREGFSWGRRSGRAFGAFVEMDCDFSHEPAALAEGLRCLGRGHDAVIGARYPDGRIVGWPLRRHILSGLANTLARTLLDPSIADYTSGFRFYSSRAIDVLLSRPQEHSGYIYLSETLACLLEQGLSIASFSIVFRNRERGASNTSLAEIADAFVGIVAIARRHRARRGSRLA